MKGYNLHDKLFAIIESWNTPEAIEQRESESIPLTAVCIECEIEFPADMVCEDCHKCAMGCMCSSGEDEDYLDEDDYNRYSV